jgi:hypothetical protein
MGTSRVDVDGHQLALDQADPVAVRKLVQVERRGSAEPERSCDRRRPLLESMCRSDEIDFDPRTRQLAQREDGLDGRHSCTGDDHAMRHDYSVARTTGSHIRVPTALRHRRTTDQMPDALRMAYGDFEMKIDLRCADCGHRWETVVKHARAAMFDAELVRDARDLIVPADCAR